METSTTLNLFSVIFILIPVLVIIVMEKIIYQKEPSQKEVDTYQIKLDKESKFISKSFGKEKKFDALYEIMRERTQQKIFVSLMIIINYITVLMLSTLIAPNSSNFKLSLIIGMVILISFAIISGRKPIRELTGLT